MRYRVISSTSSNNLEEKVNKALSYGWELVGGICATQIGSIKKPGQEGLRGNMEHIIVLYQAVTNVNDQAYWIDE